MQHRAQCTHWKCFLVFASYWLAAITPIAQAHDFWIEPETFRPAIGTKVPLRLLVGNDFKGDAALFNPEWFERYDVAAPDGLRPISGTLGDDPAGTFVATAPGLHMVAYYSKKFDVKFDSFPKFKEYLQQEGLERQLIIAEARAGKGGTIAEVYSRCAKSLIAATGPATSATTGTAAGTTASTATSPTTSPASTAATGSIDRRFGCPLELIPETNPYRQSDLQLRLLYRDKPLEGALVIASNKADPLTKLKIRTDRDGRVTFKLPRAGSWLVTSVHMISMARFVRADWESFWASLTFEVPALP